MINMFTLDRANARVAEIVARGLASDVHAVELSAYTGGTETRPELWFGHAVSYRDGTDGETRFTVWPEFREPTRSTYIIDGVGYYVAGWMSAGNGSHEMAENGWIMLHPIRQITHVGTGDVSAHMLRPTRRAYVMWSAPIAD